MSELTTASSFIIRIYRADPAEPRLLTGLVEPMDGSGARIPFADLDDLACALNVLMNRQRPRRRRHPAVRPPPGRNEP